MAVASLRRMRGLTKRQKWALVAGAASLLASQLAEQLVSRSWEYATGKEPPEDPLYKDVSWPMALAFTAAFGAVVSVSEVLGRHGAALAWKRHTGRRPPQKLRRPRG